MKPRPGAAWHPRDPVPPFRADDHPGEAVAAAVRGWQLLCDEERDSVTIASLTLADLSLLGAPPEILGAAARVVEDEIRHVEVCATVIRRLGGTPTATPPRPRGGRGDEPLEARTAHALVAGFVAGEPLSAACFAAARRRAGEPLVHWAYTELLRDEVRHGAFGAEAGAWVIRAWPPDNRQQLWPACVAEMEAFEQRAGGTDGPSSGDAFHLACQALGMVPRSVAQEAIVEAIPRWILPRLRTLGVLPTADTGTT
jgi:hypothetical protein